MAEGGFGTFGSNSTGNANTQTPAEYRTLMVLGLTPALKDELLQLYFESPKYGGGDIESLCRVNEQEARIVYNEDGGRLLGHFNFVP